MSEKLTAHLPPLYRYPIKPLGNEISVVNNGKMKDASANVKAKEV